MFSELENLHVINMSFIEMERALRRWHYILRKRPYKSFKENLLYEVSVSALFALRINLFLNYDKIIDSIS